MSVVYQIYSVRDNILTQHSKKTLICGNILLGANKDNRYPVREAVDADFSMICNNIIESHVNGISIIGEHSIAQLNI